MLENRQDLNMHPSPGNKNCREKNHQLQFHGGVFLQIYPGGCCWPCLVRVNEPIPNEKYIFVELNLKICHNLFTNSSYTLLLLFAYGIYAHLKYGISLSTCCHWYFYLTNNSKTWDRSSSVHLYDRHLCPYPSIYRQHLEHQPDQYFFSVHTDDLKFHL